MALRPGAPIVVGVDGSASAELALAWAADEAYLHERQLAVVHVIEYVGPRTRYDFLTTPTGSDIVARRIVEHARSDALSRRPTIDVTTESITEDAAHALITRSDTAAMIVVGNRGHGGFHDMILGSTSLQTASHARCPVAVIRPRVVDPHAVRLYAKGRVVVGVDGSPRSSTALDLAFAEADRRGLEITAIHAWQRPVAAGLGDAPVAYDADALEGIETSLLTEFLDAARDAYPQVPVEPLTLESPAAAALVDASAGAQLVVVGSRGHGGFSGLLLGSVSQALIHHAQCPVLVAH